MEELNAIYERMRAIFAEEAGFVPNDGCDATELPVLGTVTITEIGAGEA